MNNEDEILQHSLNTLERGSELQDVLEDLPESNDELAPLIRLAATMRTMPHPEPLRVRARARKRALLNAVGDRTRPAPPLPVKARISPNGHGPQKAKPKSAFPLLLSVAGAGVLAIFMLAFVMMLGLGVWIVAAPHNAQAATLIDVHGQVEVAAAGSADWRAVSGGDEVSSGERIRTGAASQATLVFFEGSRTVVGSNADLVLTRVDGDWGRVLRVVLTQNAGRTSHSVVPLKGKSSQFMVFTPSGAGSVHGTNFDVGVGQQGASRFAVDTGKVLVSNRSSQVFLDAGQALTFSADGALEDPDYQFTLQGSLTELDETSGMVDGITFTVTETTSLIGAPAEGQTVKVEGRILEGGEWVADSIELQQDGDSTASFTGLLEDNEGHEWVVSGQEVVVSDEAEFVGDMNLGAPVKVTFHILEGGIWEALVIELLEDEPADPTETPTATPDPQAEPILVFDPQTLEGAVCGTDFAQSASLVNNGPDPDDLAANVELGSQVIQGAEYVNGVTLNPSGWETIDPGEQAIFGIHVNLDEDSWEDAPEGTQVEVRLFVAAETNSPESHTSNLTVTITSSCEGTEAPDETEPVETVEPVETEQPIEDGAVACTGADPHPTGQSLALEYSAIGATYEAIMDWFCNYNFGFGEIDQAYSLSQFHGVPVEDIFEMRLSGLGWGQIKQNLADGLTEDPATTAEPVDTAEPVETTEPVETEPVETAEPVETEQPIEDGTVACTGADPHPTGQSLALKYNAIGATYEAIMGWFCNYNLGFGEIDQGYSLSMTYGVPVNEIFAMRLSGMGWGQIKKDLAAGGAAVPATTPEPIDNGNPVTIGPSSGSPGNGGNNSGNPNPGNGNGSNNGKKKDKGK